MYIMSRLRREHKSSAAYSFHLLYNSLNDMSNTTNVLYDSKLTAIFRCFEQDVPKIYGISHLVSTSTL